MAMEITKRMGVFFFDGLPLGILDDPMPRAAGRWRFRPFRGEGHLALKMRIHGGHTANCYADNAGERLSFVVVAKPFESNTHFLDVSVVTVGKIPD